MAFSFGFYNSLNHDRIYDANQMSAIFDGIITDGVYDTVGEKFIVHVNEEGHVIVPSGRAWFDHTWNLNDADIVLEMPLSDILLPRIDAVVIDVDRRNESRLNQILVIQGMASQEAQKPDLLKENEHKQYPLAYITRSANNEVIEAKDIENAVGTDDCPFVTALLEHVSISELLGQWRAQWQSYFNAQQSEILDWFQNLKDILDENAAIHLQNEIDDLTKKEFNHYYGLDSTTTTIEKVEDGDTNVTSTSSEATIVTVIHKEEDGSTTVTATITPQAGVLTYTKTTTIQKEEESGKTTVTESYTSASKVGD